MYTIISSRKIASFPFALRQYIKVMSFIVYNRRWRMSMTETHEIWQRFNTRLKAFIVKRINNPHDADDLLQDVFQKIHTKHHLLHDSAKLESWIYQIVRNAIIDYYRRQNEKSTPVEIVEVPEEEGDSEARLAIAKCLLPMANQLSSYYRDAFIAYEIEGLSQKKIAMRYGLSISGAKSRIQRARQQLRVIFLKCCDVKKDQHGRVIDFESKNHSCHNDVCH